MAACGAMCAVAPNEAGPSRLFDRIGRSVDEFDGHGPGNDAGRTLTNPNHFIQRTTTMLYWAAVFFVIALVAAVLGFGGIAASAAGLAKILFFVFLVLGALSLVFGRRVAA